MGDKGAALRGADRKRNAEALNAAERAVMEAALAYDQENKNLTRAMALGREMSKACAELRRLRAAQASQGSGG